MTSILIVIPCLNEERHLEGLVQKIQAQPFPYPAKIIIADGGSHDRTVEIARSLAASSPDIVYLHNPKRLQSAAINLAVLRYGAEAEFLIRLDAHADYPPDYCQILLAEADSTGADCVVVAMKTVGTDGFQSAVAAAQNSTLGNGGSAHRSLSGHGKWVDHGHHALMRIAAFTAVAGYDENFAHNEDAELDLRLTKAGFRLWLTDKTFVRYYPRASPWGLFRQYIGYGRGRASTILKHRTKPKLRQMAPAALIPILLLALAAPLGWLAIAPAFAWIMLCLGYGILLAFKARAVSIAWAGPAAMIMHLGWSIGFWHRILVC